ncbi:MAG: nucleotidyltransferase domain-containing protein [Alphaproteobacteria bacterium]|nr:nucleotidyltransferase domain-containing protein [Alphaproteobacteria bacterium]MBO4643036.1 nucleotidyltransferase domain-containing protein [Alphaproteobacteria bacterium]
MSKTDYLETAKSFLAERFPKAKCAFIAGSVVRNEATATSDIDMVIIHDTAVMPKAYRASAIFQEWPIEMFVQNDNSFAYFLKQDKACGMPALLGMIADGIIVPEGNEYAADIQNKARAVLAAGPAALSREEIDNRRYGLTDLLDDMESPKNTAELYGTLSVLYQKLGDFLLRANRRWSGGSKALTRAIKKAFPDLAPEYEAAFRQAFAGDTKPLSALADRILQPFGGRFWAGLTSYAPEEANQPEK